MTDKDNLPFELSSRLGFGALCVLVLLMAASQTQAQGSVAAGQSKSAVCAACHGADGNSPNPIWPSLAGQHADYLARQIEAFQAEAQLPIRFAGVRALEAQLVEAYPGGAGRHRPGHRVATLRHLSIAQVDAVPEGVQAELWRTATAGGPRPRGT